MLFGLPPPFPFTLQSRWTKERGHPWALNLFFQSRLFVMPKLYGTNEEYALYISSFSPATRNLNGILPKKNYLVLKTKASL